jgi:hypothetical protein
VAYFLVARVAGFAEPDSFLAIVHLGFQTRPPLGSSVSSGNLLLISAKGLCLTRAVLQ